MPPQRTQRKRTRALLGLALLVLILLLGLALLEGPDGGMACAPLAPVSAESVAPPPLDETPPLALETPPRTVQKVSAERVLNGHIKDLRTGEPVPWLDVELTVDKVSCKVRTTKDGTFSTNTDFPSGRIQAVVSDDGEEIHREGTKLERARRPGGWEIQVLIGPTIPIRRIDGQPPTPDATWRARLRENRFPFGSAGEIKVRGDRLIVPDELKERDWGWRSLRFDGDRPFVRWPKPIFKPDGGQFRSGEGWFPTLHLRSDVQFAKCDTEVKGTVGIQHEVEVTTSPFAILTGHVSIQGEGQAAPAYVLAVDEADVEAATFERVPYFAQTRSKDSKYTFETPAFRKLRIVAWTGAHVVATGHADVERGVENGPDLHLYTTFASAGDSALDLRRELVGPPKGVQVLRARLRQVAPFSEAWLLEVPVTGLVDTGRIPTGDYRVENIGFDAEPTMADIHPDQPLPAVGLDPSRRSGQYPRPHRIDAGSPELNAVCDISAGPAGSLFLSDRWTDPPVWHLSAGNPAVFTVWYPGGKPLLVTEKDFLPNGGELMASVHPTSGWGVLLAFRAEGPRSLDPRDQARGSSRRTKALEFTEAFAMPPLPGVQVHFKGVPLGVSDKDGCVLACYTVPPESLSLIASGWRLNKLERIPGPGSRWWVWMKRDP